MGRKRTGSVETLTDAHGNKYHRARILLGDGSRIRIINDTPMSDARARDWATWCQETEDRDGALLAKKMGDAAKLAALTGETFATYVDRWVEERKERGVSSWDTEGGYLKKHVVPLIGARAMTTIDKAAVEDVRDAIDRKIRKKVFKWKTGRNIWGLVTSLFDDACKAKTRALRVLTVDPTDGVLPPDKGDDTAKTYLYPKEFLQLVACEDVPLRFRRLFCLAVYLYARAGEINALEFGKGIDRDHGLAEITEQVDRRTAKREGTKTGITRRLPIEPNLDPLLAVLAAEAGGTGRVAQVSETDRKLALTLRRCLVMAGVTRRALHEKTATAKPIGFHDLRATGITWAAARGDEPYKLMQRAGHKSLATTQKYIREAENLRESIGQVFPELPEAALQSATNRPRFATEQVRMRKNKVVGAVEAPGIEYGADAPISGIPRVDCGIPEELPPQSDDANPAMPGPKRPRSAHSNRPRPGLAKPPAAPERVAHPEAGASPPPPAPSSRPRRQGGQP